MASGFEVKSNRKGLTKQCFSTNNYFPHLRFNGTSFEVRNEEDLKNLLYGIEQRFYTTVATYEKRCASAVYSLE